jgi:hypothetical protein
MVSIAEDSKISLAGYGKTQGSNLTENKCDICTFSLITIPENTFHPLSPMMINISMVTP